MDDKFADRRRAFKSPGASQRATQETRRAQALEEQKRKRAQCVESSRQLDLFAELSLDASDDEILEDDTGTGTQTPMSGVGQYSNILHIEVDDAELPPGSRTPSPSPFADHDPSRRQGNKSRSKRRRKKGKGKKAPGPWANKCMYAELLEMREDASWAGSWDAAGASGLSDSKDGLPVDLDSSWVGLAPVPVGKRCLAVTMQSAGVSGIVPNTMLRSRLLGKVIIHPFPSPFPPNTILDCILDENWRKNGILHVLDVVRWKSQDLGSCEASFRFWWRDTRLSEVSILVPQAPAPHKSSFSSDLPEPTYRYAYPTTFVSVPYCSPLPYDQVLGDLIQRARAGRIQHVRIPVLSASSKSTIPYQADGDAEMEVDNQAPGPWSVDRLEECDICIDSDGLLLYVGEAAYEPGESPLSVWVPKKPPEKTEEAIGLAAAQSGEASASTSYRSSVESPLDCFERLVRRRMIRKGTGVCENAVNDRSMET